MLSEFKRLSILFAIAVSSILVRIVTFKTGWVNPDMILVYGLLGVIIVASLIYLLHLLNLVHKQKDMAYFTALCGMGFTSIAIAVLSWSVSFPQVVPRPSTFYIPSLVGAGIALITSVIVKLRKVGKA